jgi:hypothetical protein
MDLAIWSSVITSPQLMTNWTASLFFQDPVPEMEKIND